MSTDTLMNDAVVAALVKQRTYEHFMEDHDPKPWTPGRCAGYKSGGSLGMGRDGKGLASLFCHVHAKDERDNGHYERQQAEQQ